GITEVLSDIMQKSHQNHFFISTIFFSQTRRLQCMMKHSHMCFVFRHLLKRAKNVENFLGELLLSLSSLVVTTENLAFCCGCHRLKCHLALITFQKNGRRYFDAL